MVLPGFVAADLSTLPLRRYLKRLGHKPSGWRLGRNIGPSAEIMDGIERRLLEETERAQRPVPLIGWSLGGIYARHLAMEHPDRVDQVISLGSPFNITNSEPTTVGLLWDLLDRRYGYTRDREDTALDEIPVPSTSIYTRTDGIVSWQSCLQSEGETSENIEVNGSHCGLGFNVVAAQVVADRLAQKPGTWTHYRPTPAMRLIMPEQADPIPVKMDLQSADS